MKVKDTAKVAAATFAIGMIAGVAGEMYMASSGRMRSARKKANKAIKTVGNIVEDVKDFIS
ncbi:MAG: hypothetical protein UHN02_01300 [Acutalibacteraceae bacterium]|nr:hypothetical protein [Acutalibacteraceae bacterium]